MQSCYNCDHLKRCGESIYCMWNGKDKAAKIPEGEVQHGSNCLGWTFKKKVDRTICESCAFATWFGSELYCPHNSQWLTEDGTCEKHETIPDCE